MRVIIIISLLFFISMSVSSQDKTAASMYLKKNKNTQLEYIESKSGNLFNRLGHHGPAIENQWYALRLYFNKKAAIDVYSKAKPGLELTEKRWYPSKSDQLEGWGADYYKVGKTVGLGGVKLWDGEKILDLHPVKLRSARVTATEDSSSIEMLSEGVAYLDKTVDIMVRVTMYSSVREAKVEAFSMDGEAVCFVTGINYFENLKIEKGKNFAYTWGIHPEDVAAEKVEVGAAITLDKEIIESQLDDGKQVLFITLPTSSFSTRVTSYTTREDGIDSYESFKEQINNFIRHED